MKKFFFVLLLLFPVLCLGADVAPPADRAVAVGLLKDFITNAWPALVAWLISEVMPFLPTKANGIAHFAYTWVKSQGEAPKD